MTKQRLVKYLISWDVYSRLFENGTNQPSEAIVSFDGIFKNIFRASIIDLLKTEIDGNIKPDMTKKDTRKLYRSAFESVITFLDGDAVPDEQRSAFILELVEWIKKFDRKVFRQKVREKGRPLYRDINEGRNMIEIESPGYKQVYPICKNCGHSFLKLPGERRVYCRPACQQEALRKRKRSRKMKCPICHESYTRERSDKLTCGKDSCRKAFYREHGPVRKRL